MLNLLKAAQARKLDRVAAAYAVAGWLLVQGASITLPLFGAPEWALRVFVAAVLIGFPLTLGVAWVMAPHPHPIEGTTPTSSRRPDIALLAALGIVIALSVAQFAYEFSHGASSNPIPSTGPQDASIAVLPFENLSSDKDAGYFAAGIQDEILTRLTKIGALKVISRTSTEHYASRPDNLPEIARSLGVANILEGSVQRAGNSVHINVQLIHAASDTHLWAEVYDRKLDDIFGVEGEVATAIAEALKAKVTGDEKEVLAA